MLPGVKKALIFIKDKLVYPDNVVLESASGPEVRIDGRKVLMFGSYNYLGLANNYLVKRRAFEVLHKFGVGSGGVRLLTGTMVIHEKLERKVARFTKQDQAMTLSSGYGVNVGVIPGLVNFGAWSGVSSSQYTTVFNDEYNHASIIDGCRLSNAKIVTYKHCNMTDLEEKLHADSNANKLIITDGVFSMDGDIAPLDKIIDLAKHHRAMTMVDDAHAFGVLGKNGSGTAEHFGREGQIDLNMGTFSKGIGVSGGFVSGNNEVIEFLRVSCRPYMFSDSLSPVIVGAVDAALEIIEEHPEIINELHEKADYFRVGLQRIGFSTINSQTHIIPLLIGDSLKTIQFSRELLRLGLFAPPIRWPAVEKNLGRIRFAMNRLHSYKQIDLALSIVEQVKEITKY